MPFFPLAGGEIVVLVLCYAIARWIYRSWRTGELEDEVLLRFLPRRQPRDEAPPPGPPKLRVIQGGREDAPDAPARARRIGHESPRR